MLGLYNYVDRNELNNLEFFKYNHGFQNMFNLFNLNPLYVQAFILTATNQIDIIRDYSKHIPKNCYYYEHSGIYGHQIVFATNTNVTKEEMKYVLTINLTSVLEEENIYEKILTENDLLEIEKDFYELNNTIKIKR